jgi:serpin B
VRAAELRLPQPLSDRRPQLFVATSNIPDAGTQEQFEAALTGPILERILSRLTRTDVDLYLPRFKMEGSFELKEALEQLGMKQPFYAPPADFSGIDGSLDLYISKIIHKSCIAVDEAGTEAAAATAVIMEASASPFPPEPVVVRLDRPFLFAIRDIPTNTLLFVGRVVAP